MTGTATSTFETTGSGTVNVAGAYTVPTMAVNGGGTINDELPGTITLTSLTITEGTLNLKSTGGISDSGNISILDGTLNGPSTGAPDAVRSAGTSISPATEVDQVCSGRTSRSPRTGPARSRSATPSTGTPLPAEDIASPITTNTTDSAAGAVTINVTITGASGTAADTTVTSTNEPITLGSGTWQGGGPVTTLTAPGFVWTPGTMFGAQTLTQNGGTMTLGSGQTITIPHRLHARGRHVPGGWGARVGCRHHGRHARRNRDGSGRGHDTSGTVQGGDAPGTCRSPGITRRHRLGR